MLVVNDFGVKYVGTEHAEHLMSILSQHYEVESNWMGKKYIGLPIDWKYAHRKVHILMPKYATKALQRLQHPTPTKPQNAPYQYTPPQYGAKAQYTKAPNTSPLLDE